MTRRIGLMLIAIAAFASVFASADNAEARHRRGRGSCGSWGGNGSYGGGGSFGGFFSRRNNGSRGSHGSYGGNGSHGGSYQNNSCGSHGGSYQVVEESAPQSASIEGTQGEVRYYGQRDESTYESGGRRIHDRGVRAGAGAAIGVESSDSRDRDMNERRDDARGERQDVQSDQRSADDQGQSQRSRDSGQDSNQNQNENRNQNDNQQPPPPPSGT